MLAGYREGERDNGEKRRLFGQDQLVFAGDAQQVELSAVIDFKCGGTLQQRSAIDSGARGCRGGGDELNRDRWRTLFHFGENTNKN